MIERTSIRAILITPEHEVLLMEIADPAKRLRFWITPGGGIEPGETEEEALRRELSEEVGLEDFEIGPEVWRRHYTFDWNGERISQLEHYRVVHTERFEPVMTDAIEAATMSSFHWWSLADLAATHVRLTPLSLATIVRRYLDAGAPATLPEVEVLVD